MKKFQTATVALAFSFVALSLSACRLDSESGTIDRDNLPLAENTIMACSDGIDNDGNGLIDCDDPGCKTKGTPEALGPGDTVCPDKENNIYVCADGKDNDGNGYVDCEDNSCKGTAVCCIATGTEGDTIESCSDGIDNDCNGYVDCNDNSCWKSKNPEVKAYCQKIRCPFGTQKEGDTIESCSDGIDNDCDGYVDCNARACSQSKNQEVVEYCKMVNDKTYVPTDPSIDNINAVDENTPERCMDGKDNDFNGLTDCEDPGCIALNLEYCKGIEDEPPKRPANFDSLSAQERLVQLQREFDSCTDGVDNNRNGRYDCDEYQCQLLSLQVLTGDEAKYQIKCPNQEKQDSQED